MKTFVDLGMSPLSNSFLTSEQLYQPETFYPLCAWVCLDCFLVQLDEFVTPKEIFSEYSYFSSFSDSWLAHCRAFAREAISRFALSERSSVVEIASNDGSLLSIFNEAGVPALGIEPAQNVASVALQKGLSTRVAFFNTRVARELVEEGVRADLVIANNVLAHVPNLNDFVAAARDILAPRGVLSIEFPHLLRLIEQVQFDTIYHEHFSYFSLATVKNVLNTHGLCIFDVQQIPTHGGSLRIFARHVEDSSCIVDKSVETLLSIESTARLDSIEGYNSFQSQVATVRRNVLRFLIEAKESGDEVVGYGAAAKGNTLLNYCGVRHDLVSCVVDRNPYKQGRFLPGTHIPIHAPECIKAKKPRYIFILPWNIRQEISEQLSFIRQWNGKFVVPIPTFEIF